MLLLQPAHAPLHFFLDGLRLFRNVFLAHAHYLACPPTASAEDLNDVDYGRWGWWGGWDLGHERHDVAACHRAWSADSAAPCSLWFHIDRLLLALSEDTHELNTER